MLYAFFWIIPRRLIFIYRGFGKLGGYLPAYGDGTECSEMLAYKNSDAGELPRRKHRTCKSMLEEVYLSYPAGKLVS
jgi:hypothetical protein